MGFNRKAAGAFGRVLKALVTKDANFVGDVELRGEFATNKEKGKFFVDLIRQIAETGKPKKRIDLGLKPQYLATKNTIHFRFINPDSPQNSQSLAILKIRDTGLFDQDKIQALMEAIIRPDEHQANPLQKPKSPHA